MLRTSCVLTGCCVGGVCDSGFCLAFPPHSQVWNQHIVEGIIASPLDWSAPVLPLHLLFMLWALAVGLLLTRLHKFRKFDGQVLLSFLFVHEAGKFLLEFLRVPSVPLVQIGSLVVSVLAGFALLGLWLRNRPQSAGVQIT